MLNKKIFFSLILFSFSFQILAQTFEGKIFIFKIEKDTLSESFLYQNEKLLIEKDSGKQKITVITDLNSGDKWSLMSKGDKKIAVKQNIYKSLALKHQRELTHKQLKAIEVKLELTKEEKIINELTCLKIKGKTNNWEAEAWITKSLRIDYADLFPLLVAEGNESHAIQHAFAKEGFVIQLWIRNIITQKEVTLHTQLKPHKIDPKLFQISDDYETLDMTNMRVLMHASKEQPEKLKLIREMMHRINKH